jgi:hypothetical protein
MNSATVIWSGPAETAREVWRFLEREANVPAIVTSEAFGEVVVPQGAAAKARAALRDHYPEGVVSV